MLRRTQVLIFLLHCAGAQAAAQTPPGALRGRVLTSAGTPLTGANAFLLETLEGALTDSAGSFTIETSVTGAATLVVLAAGFSEERMDVVLPAPGPLIVTLEREAIALAPIEVHAGRYVAADAPDASLSALQVVTTPGAQADVYRALQTFPGLQQVDEGAGLFVRGGDVSETRVFLDDALVLSPYRYESPTGGFFGAFDPFLLSGIVFSSGGFGARWGDALSGVAALQTRGRPPRSSMGATASLAALSATGSLPLPRGLGAHITATRSHTRLLFEVNGSTSEFTRVPEGRDLSGSLVWRYGAEGEVRLFAIDQATQLGVVVDEASYSGAFEADEGHAAWVLSWRDHVGRARPSISLGLAGTSRSQSFGAFTLDTRERLRQARAQVAIETSPSWTITLGGELERRSARFAGSVPEADYDVGPSARREVFSSRVAASRNGAFLEADWWAMPALRVTTGVRADRSSLTHRWTVDPRLSAALLVGEGAALTAAWGIYHQVASPFFYEPVVGDTTLPPMRAVHYVLGAQLGREALLLRLEAYLKTYRELAQRTRDYDVARDGTGTSRGLDVFLRWPAVWGFRGRAAQSFIRARRTDPDAGVLARSPFDVSRVSTLVLERSFGSAWSAAAAYRSASGRPFTEIVGAAFDAGQGVWIPTYGPPMAERLPGFRRFDLSASHLHNFFGPDLTVLFVGVTNVLDRTNLHGYRYSADYSERTPVRSPFKRAVYFGASISF